MLPQLGLLEMLIVMGVAVLLFGKRLPEVGRSLGRGIIEFKKGLTDVTDNLGDGSSNGGEISAYSSGSSSPRRDDYRTTGDTAYSEASVPKFELPGAVSTTAPKVEAATDAPAGE